MLRLRALPKRWISVTAPVAPSLSDNSDVVVGFWSSGEFLVDRFSKMDQNIIRIRGLSDIDVAVRNVESFAAIQDVTTA